MHKRLWDEAALSAVIEFLVREVGICEIYCHTWEGGRLLKAMPKEIPPRSVYEKLSRLGTSNCDCGQPVRASRTG